MNKPYRILTLIILITALLDACANSGTATPGASPTLSTASGATSAAPETPAMTDTPAVTATTEATPTAEATATVEATVTATTGTMSDSDCLVGTWKFADISDYLGSILAQAEGVVTYTGSEGNILYTFGADGKASINAQDYVAKFEMKAQNLTLPLELHMTGSANVNYTSTAPNQITFSDVQGTGLKFSATMGGQELFSSTPAEMSAAFGVSDDPKYNTFTYECSATALKYTPPVKDAKPITLERVQ